MLTKDDDFNVMLRIEEDAINEMCSHIVKLKPDLVITEKGISDLAMHIFIRNNISAIRRVRKTDNNRIARAVGATIVNRPEELNEKDVGTGCGLFKIEKIGDEYFTFMVECKSPKACSIMLRGAGKEFLNEIERNLQDALSVARNVVLHPSMVPGGGASEMAVATYLTNKAKTLSGAQALPYRAVAKAFEVIPRTLAENCGSPVIRVVTELRAKHMQGLHTYGVDGIEGKVEDMNKTGIWEPYEVKAQTFKTAVESAALLLRIDDIVSGLSKHQEGGSPAQQPTAEEAEAAMGEQA
jgi:T-complex protein 1 subunit gamma